VIYLMGITRCKNGEREGLKPYQRSGDARSVGRHGALGLRTVDEGQRHDAHKVSQTISGKWRRNGSSKIQKGKVSNIEFSKKTAQNKRMMEQYGQEQEIWIGAHHSDNVLGARNVEALGDNVVPH